MFQNVLSCLTGSCLHTIHGFIGDTVLLPCSYDDVQGLSQKITIFWVDKDDKVVLEIPKNGLEPYTDEPEYKGRVESFQELHKTGNFSILLKNVQQSNSGPFDCRIPSIYHWERSVLNVTGLYSSREEEVPLHAVNGVLRNHLWFDLQAQSSKRCL